MTSAAHASNGASREHDTRFPEIWGGVECTICRNGDTFSDQCTRNGHAERLSDLDLFAELGIRTLRTPVLWERAVASIGTRADLSWAGSRLARMRALGLRPIAGLIHHGSGPRGTDLSDPAFPERFADYARAVAETFPWIEAYTPVNEPLTTARFSGLYGHWYPHRRDHPAFLTMLFHEIKATVLAMRAIRAVNPKALLVQTEDLGKVYSTPRLKYQADFENERRFLSLDLLTGRLGRGHPQWDFLLRSGAREADLEWFLENTCPPDVMGFNHYVTSNRYLDEEADSYPPQYDGGNGRHRYADIEAVRVFPQMPSGSVGLLREVWERYRAPIALTEVHLGATRDEQMRWLRDAWEGAIALRAEGVDMRAITAWSLLGAFDWNSLLTRSDGFYEPGVFDVRSPAPRPTGLAFMIRDLAAQGRHDHPVLDCEGWWRRPERVLHPTPWPAASMRVRDVAGGAHAELGAGRGVALGARRPRTILITGAAGTLGHAFSRLCDARGLPYHALTRGELDITDPVALEAALDALRPWAVVNAAGFARVDDAERDVERCMRTNTLGPAHLAAASARRQIRMLTFSSAFVFDGTRRVPLLERVRAAPLNVYGRSKADAEAFVLERNPQAMVVRSGPFFGPWDDRSFIARTLDALARGDAAAAADDVVVSPTFLPDLVNTGLDLLIDGADGLWHLANGGAVSWTEFARMAARSAGLNDDRIQGRPQEALGYRARRPAYSALGSERATILPSLEHALSRFAWEWTAARGQSPSGRKLSHE